MLKKLLAAICCIMLVFTVGCDKDVVYADPSDYDDSETPKQTENLLVNPLTGVEGISEDAAARRPVAIMINNISTAQKVQTGLNRADIIYETEVEGGVTRLMAVYQDITKLDKIGSVRSARYPYVDLALGHNAIYIHCGQDPTYCAPHLKDIDDISIDTNSKGAKRISNGLASEHTLYAIAGDLWSSISEKFKTANSNTAEWVNFTNEPLSLDGGSAASITVPFPAAKTNFTYDAQSGLYTRLLGGAAQSDYFTKEQTQVKNVFVLLTNISTYPDGKHRKVDLVGGDGYYATNGTMQFIKWSKGNANDSIKFTDTEGNEIKVAAGNSWVCIANKSTCTPNFQ